MKQLTEKGKIHRFKYHSFREYSCGMEKKRIKWEEAEMSGLLDARVGRTENLKWSVRRIKLLISRTERK